MIVLVIFRLLFNEITFSAKVMHQSRKFFLGYTVKTPNYILVAQSIEKCTF